MTRDEAVDVAAGLLAKMDHARLARMVRHLEGEHLGALLAALRSAANEDRLAEMLLVDRDGQ